MITPAATALVDNDFEAVLMAVTEVFLPLAHANFDERNVGAVTLHQVGAVIAVFVAIPVVVVAAVTIVIAGFPAMVFGYYSYGSDYQGGQYQSAENCKLSHVVDLLVEKHARHKPLAVVTRNGDLRGMFDGISSGDPTRSRERNHHKCHLWNNKTYAARSALVVAWAAIASPILPRRSKAQA
jgi:hypothetical protein